MKRMILSMLMFGICLAVPSFTSDQYQLIATPTVTGTDLIGAQLSITQVAP